MRYLVAPFPDRLPRDPLEVKALVHKSPRELGRLNLAGQTIDVSGGGIFMQTSTALQPNNAVFLSIDVSGAPGEPGLKVRQAGRVVRTLEVRVQDERVFRAGIAFVGLEERERDEIVRFLFNEEARRRREQR